MFCYTSALLRFMSLFCVTCALASCATTPPMDVPESEAPSRVPEVLTTPPPLASLTVEKRALGLLFRDLTEQTNAGLVLMNGLENINIEGLSMTDTPLPEILSEINRITGLSTHSTPHYTFMFDPAYESLVTMDFQGGIPGSYDDVRVFASFGSDTPLFSVFALLSRLTGKTLIADNAVADALCGEINLHDVPLPQAIEAVLQSARIPQSGVQLRATDDYIFVHSAVHTLRRAVASAAISDADRKILAEPCSISLLVYTEADNKVRSQLGASKLYKVLPELSLQLGIPVRVDADLNHFPVNPMVMNDVTRDTALKLFIHQWLVPEFEYTVVDGTVLIRRVATR